MSFVWWYEAPYLISLLRECHLGFIEHANLVQDHSMPDYLLFSDTLEYIQPFTES
jgi:hypothetical protein